jgi:hypothetical protein
MSDAKTQTPFDLLIEQIRAVVREEVAPLLPANNELLEPEERASTLWLKTLLREMIEATSGMVIK